MVIFRYVASSIWLVCKRSSASIKDIRTKKGGSLPNADATVNFCQQKAKICGHRGRGSKNGQILLSSFMDQDGHDKRVRVRVKVKIMMRVFIGDQKPMRFSLQLQSLSGNYHIDYLSSFNYDG